MVIEPIAYSRLAAQDRVEDLDVLRLLHDGAQPQHSTMTDRLHQYVVQRVTPATVVQRVVVGALGPVVVQRVTPATVVQRMVCALATEATAASATAITMVVVRLVMASSRVGVRASVPTQRSKVNRKNRLT